MYRFLTAVELMAAFACGLCLAGAITFTALTIAATKLWIGAAVFFVIFAIATNLKPKKPYDY